MELFKLGEDRLVTIDKVAIGTIKEFKAILVRDENRLKKRAISEFTFIFNWCDPRSLFFNYDGIRKLKECLKNSDLPENYEYTKDEKLILAIAKYNEFLEDEIPSLGLYRSTLKGVDVLRKFLETLTIEDPDDAKKIIDVLSKIGLQDRALREDYKKLREEMQLSSGLRGKSNKGTREDPK